MKTTDRLTIQMISLGCAKNASDTEEMMGALGMAGYEFSGPGVGADAILINTCCFIGPATDESMAAIHDALRSKNEGRCKYVIVTGCLSQRSAASLSTQMPEIDAVLGTGEYPRIVEALDAVREGRKIVWIGEPTVLPDADSPRLKLTPPHYAYVKIADGCDNRCSYCLIPSLRGRFRSRTIDSVVAEAHALVESGAKEIVLVAHDTTAFGMDRGSPDELPVLLERLCEIDGLHWVRVLYAHPARITEALAATISANPQITNYLDIPLQHSEDRVLKSMGRRITRDGIDRLIRSLRAEIPGLVLRSTFMVGYPGETEREFDQLIEFIERARFERVGLFKYSQEPGTTAATLPGQVPEQVKEDRYHAALTLQQTVSLELNKRTVGSVFEVLVDEAGGPGEHTAGRSYRDAPEVDGVVLLAGANVNSGSIVRAEITGATEYDLEGSVVDLL